MKIKARLRFNIASTLLWITGKRKVKSAVILLHGINKQRYTEDTYCQPDISIEEFEAILDWFKANSYNFLTPEEYLNGAEGVLLTFDDGFKNNYTNALPILEKYQAPAIFFISSHHIENQGEMLWFMKERISSWTKNVGVLEDAILEDVFLGLSLDDLTKLSESKYATIGGHTHTHPYLSKCNKDEAKKEILINKEFLEQQLGVKVEYFAYPLGDYTKSTIEIAQEIFKNSFAVTPNFGLNKHHEIPRIGIYSGYKSYLESKMRMGR